MGESKKRKIALISDWRFPKVGEIGCSIHALLKHLPCCHETSVIEHADYIDFTQLFNTVSETGSLIRIKSSHTRTSPLTLNLFRKFG